MEITQEIILLSNTLISYDDESRAIALIKDITDGLCDPHDEEEQEFWRTKIAFFLLNSALKNSSNATSFVAVPPHCSVHLSWQLFFNITNKSHIFGHAVTLAYSSLPKNLLHILIEQFFTCFNVEMSDQISDVNDLIAGTATLVVGLLSCPCENSRENLATILAEKLSVIFSEYSVPTLDRGFGAYHIRNIEYALLKLKQIVEYGSDQHQEDRSTIVDVAALKSLQNMLHPQSTTSYLHRIDALQQITDKQTILDGNCHPDRFVIGESMKNLLKELYVWYKQIIDMTGLMNHQKVRSEGDISPINLLVQFCQEIDLIIEFPKDVNESCNIHSDGFQKWNLESALFCATQLLDGFNDATTFLLSYMTGEDCHIEIVERCVASLCEYPECMYRSEHIFELRQFLTRLNEKCSETAKNVSVESLRRLLNLVWDLFLISYEHMPLNSKVAMLENWNNGNGILLGDRLTNVTLTENERSQQKINMIFNTLTKLDEQNNSADQLLSSICDISIINPIATIRKIVDQVIYHKEHHTILSGALCRLPCLVCIMDVNENNVFLECLCKIEQSGNEDNITKNICNFLSLLFNACESKLNNQVVTLLTHQLLHGYILPALADPVSHTQNTISLKFGLSLVQCVYKENEKRLESLTLFDMFSLAYFLARILDAAVVTDDIMIMSKSILLCVVALTSERMPSDVTDSHVLWKWLQHASHCFRWTTQLYLRPILTKNKSHTTIVPLSIKDVCILQDTSGLNFVDVYGEGTGLTSWLQCLLIEPSLFPISSLALDNLTVKEQDMFAHGMVIALTQVLPHCLEDDWHTVIEAVKGLLVHNWLCIDYPTNRVKYLPFLDLRQYRYCLCTMELLHRVTSLLGSGCSEGWMTAKLWNRFSKYYAIAVKQFVTNCTSTGTAKLEDTQQQVIVLSQLFMYSCDFLTLLESLPGSNAACDSIFVLLLDVVTELCKIFQSSQVQADDDAEKSTAPTMIKRNIIHLKPIMLSYAETIQNDHMEDTLVQKLIDLSQ